MRSSRRLVRWIALTASCVALAVSGAPAREAPRAERPIAALVTGAGQPSRQVVQARRDRVHPARASVSHARSAAPRPESIAPAGRPLYLLHRSLLR